MNVSATPIPVARANSRSAAAAPTRATPLPASTTGLIAERITATAFSSSCADGSGLRMCGARGQRHGVDLRRHHVLGQLDVGRAGLLGLRDLERLADDLGDDVRGVQARVPLRHRLHNRDDVDVLVGLLVHALEVALAGQGDERRAVQERVCDAGHEVRRPGAERAEADARALGQAPVHVRHVGAALLMPNRNEVDRGVGERFVEVERLLSRDAEDVLDALHLQAFHEQVRRLALHTRNFSPPVVSG